VRLQFSSVSAELRKMGEFSLNYSLVLLPVVTNSP